MAWHVAYTEPSRELFACEQLRAQNFSVFCPFERVKSRRRFRGNIHRICTTETPLFPRYVFVETEDVPSVLATRGVAFLIGTAEGPTRVPDAVIDWLRDLTHADGQVGDLKDLSSLSSRLGWRKGQKFNFRLGHPLGGLLGRLADISSLDSTGRVQAWVEMFGSERAVDVSYKDVITGKSSKGQARIAA